MKKLVPDPPPVLSPRSDITHADALHHAQAHLNTAISAANQMPGQSPRKRQTLMDTSVLHMEMARCMVNTALKRLPLSNGGAS